jgi:tetratricopeptide (TPR) repeat protein
MGKFDGPRKSYEECVAIDPNYADAYHNLAGFLDKRGDRRGLIRHLNAPIRRAAEVRQEERIETLKCRLQVPA